MSSLAISRPSTRPRGRPEARRHDRPFATRMRAAEAPVVVLLCCVFLSGVINLAPPVLGSLYPATFVGDLCIGGMVLAVASRILSGRGKLGAPGWGVAMIALALTYFMLIPFGSEDMGLQVAEIRTRAGYPLVALYIYVFLRDQRALLRLVNLSTVLALVACGVGVVQQAVPAQLPEWLLVAPGETKFSYEGTEILRANGLVGNTIVFAALMVLFFAVSLARALETSSLVHYLAAVVFMGGAIASYSRMAIVSLAPVALIVLLLVGRRRRQSGGRSALAGSLLPVLTIVVGLAVAAVSGMLDGLIRNDFLLNGLFDGTNASVSGSTDRHFYQLDVALDAFQRNLFTGIGTATQRLDSHWALTHTVITDGAIWLVLAEAGLLAGGVTFVLLIACARALVKASTTAPLGWLACGVLGFYLFQVVVASNLNSAVLGKVVVVSGSVLFGAAVASARASASELGARLEPRIGGRSPARRYRLKTEFEPPRSGSTARPWAPLVPDAEVHDRELRGIKL